MNVLFKCDKSKNIGLGHFYRCAALAEIFKKNGHKCYFLGLKLGIKKKNVLNIKDQEKDIKFTNHFIKKKNIKVVVKDIYSLNFKWEKKIANNAFLVVIDDYNSEEHYCNLYINYHYNWFKKANNNLLTKKNCKKMIGPEFSILRDLKIIKKIKTKNSTIFVYMGGADKKMFMFKIMKLLQNKKLDKYKKIFLLNENHIKSNMLAKLEKKFINTKILKNKIKNFHQYLFSSDLVISSAGLTMYEQIALNSNSLIISQNNLQNKIANLLAKKKVINFTQNIENLNYKIINKLLIKRKINKKNLINKNGKYLVYKSIISDYNKNLKQ